MSSWQLLSAEILQWQQPVQFWWRDDDAIANTPALQQMLKLAQEYSIAVHLAVIPAALETSLNTLKSVANKPYSYVLQHGFEHKSYALPKQRKIELGGTQNSQLLLQKLQRGNHLLAAVFDRQYLNILVPPWNRIADDLALLLPDNGYRKLSILGTAKQRDQDFQLNVHIDIINWKQRAFAGETVVLDKIIAHLRDKRLNPNIGSTKPCGLMTHHLDHDPQCWHFLQKFFTFCQQYPQIEWLSGQELFDK